MIKLTTLLEGNREEFINKLGHIFISGDKIPVEGGSFVIYRYPRRNRTGIKIYVNDLTENTIINVLKKLQEIVKEAKMKYLPNDLYIKITTIGLEYNGFKMEISNLVKYINGMDMEEQEIDFYHLMNDNILKRFKIFIPPDSPLRNFKENVDKEMRRIKKAYNFLKEGKVYEYTYKLPDEYLILTQRKHVNRLEKGQTTRTFLWFLVKLSGEIETDPPGMSQGVEMELKTMIEKHYHFTLTK